MRYVFIIGIFIFLFTLSPLLAIGQTIMNLDELITVKEKDSDQKKFLIAFKNHFLEDDHYSCEEYADHYKITVSHPNSNGFTGGAECYQISKQNGKWDLIWHEHPTKLSDYFD